MIYQFHHICYREYCQSKDAYKMLCEQKEVLFDKTQPRAIDYSKDRVQNTHTTNPIEKYIIDLDRLTINERIKEAHSIVSDRQYLLQFIEADLQRSVDLLDKVYYYRYVRRQKLDWIRKMIGISESQTKRLYKAIKQSLTGER